MADISKITTLDGITYNIKDATARENGKVSGVKGNAESSYRTGNVNITAANVGAIAKNETANTQQLSRPKYLNGAADNTLDAKINTLRANRLAFLPANQIIIEKTTDGGTTWVDAGIADSTKVGLFSETRAAVSIPLLNGVKSILCGLRITITAMKYNVPDGTSETNKYSYWNSNYVTSTERYNQLKEMYFWVSANSDTIGLKIERAKGSSSTTWETIFTQTGWGLTGWSGNDYVKFSSGVFGGSTNQTGNYWNYRLTFMTKGPNGSDTLATTYTTSAQSIMEIRGYGDTWWTAGNEYAANDKIYTHDYQKNVTFPAKVTATGGFSGSLSGNVSGTATTATNVSTQGAATNSTARHIWFSDSSTETKRAHDDNLKYTPSTNTITANISGNAATATKATQDESGNNIKATYAASASISGNTVTLKNKNGGTLSTITIPTELPAVTTSDNGKVLRVVSGVWTAASLPSASGVSF